MTYQTLNLEQTAAVCGVSLSRVKKWIGGRGLKVDTNDPDNAMVNHDDLIDFLIKYNMPIPESFIPYKAKKLLITYTSTDNNCSFIKFLVRFLGELKKETNFIVDHVAYGTDTKMKLMVFKPDLILLDMTINETDALDICRFVKETDEYSPVRLIGVSSDHLYKLHESIAMTYGIDKILNRSIEISPFIQNLKYFF